MLGSLLRIVKSSTIFSWSSLINILKFLYYLFLLIGVFFIPFFSFLFIALFFVITRFALSLWWALRKTEHLGIAIAEKTKKIGDETLEGLAGGLESTGEAIIKAQEHLTEKVQEAIHSEKIRAKKIVKEGADFIDSKL